ncbi:hypothetical protein [Streptomyces sp. NPDC003006]
MHQILRFGGGLLAQSLLEEPPPLTAAQAGRQLRGTLGDERTDHGTEPYRLTPATADHD